MNTWGFQVFTSIHEAFTLEMTRDFDRLTYIIFDREEVIGLLIVWSVWCWFCVKGKIERRGCKPWTCGVNTWKNKPSHAFSLKISRKQALCEGVTAFLGNEITYTRARKAIGKMHFTCLFPSPVARLEWGQICGTQRTDFLLRLLRPFKSFHKKSPQP